MSTFYAARHSAKRTSPSIARRAGVGVLASTALGLGATTMMAPSASAQGGPESPASQSSASTAPSAGSTSTSASTSGSGDTVERGDTGGAVEEIQEQVGVSTDGVFGSQTESAVQSWQGDNGLAADGVVGPETASAMGLDGGSSSASTGSSSSSASTVSSSSNASTGSSSSSWSSSSSDASTSSYGASSASSSDAGSSDSSVLGTAQSLVGSPYVMGGTDPSGFDCSGLVQYAFAQHGTDVPRTSQEQMAAATPVSDPQPGDVVFFGDDAYHNGIYAGDGKIVDAGNPGTGVTERDIWTDDVSYGRF